MTSTASGGGLGQEIYTGAADFGVAWALIGAITGTIIGIIMIIGGIYVLMHRNDYTPVQGKVTLINGSATGQCQSSLIHASNGSSSNDTTVFNCLVTVQFSYKGEDRKADISYSGNKGFYVGQVTTVYVRTNDPEDVSLNGSIPGWVSAITISFGLVIAIGGWFWYWASKRWKFVAAAEGASGAWHIIRG